MGCITSKGITRSISIREELSQRSAAWEELLSSHRHSANDHLLAFVCSSRRKTGSFALPLSTTDAETTPPPAPADETTSPDVEVKLTKSRSCHATVTGENRSDLNDKDQVGGSRSFHTVEEYDALLLRIHQQSSEGMEVVVDDSTSHKGWKRKALAGRLKLLDTEVPRVKQRMLVQGQGQIYSPATYETPKFGSYNAPATPQAEDRESTTVFSPELVAAFEDCMQQLQLEEDTILRQMDEVDYVPNT